MTDKQTIAIVDSYPVLIEIFDINYDIDDTITFKSNLSDRTCTNTIHYDNDDDAYFKHFGQKYYLNECLKIFI